MSEQMRGSDPSSHLSDTLVALTATKPLNLTALTAQIVAAHVGNNPVTPNQVSQLIRQVWTQLSDLGQPPEASLPVPAVPISKSVYADYLICLEDGKRMKMLRRHLTSFNLTPDAYRKKWGLPANYPMVAPNYAEVRSKLAKKSGLGRTKKPEVVRRRGRPRKA